MVWITCILLNRIKNHFGSCIIVYLNTQFIKSFWILYYCIFKYTILVMVNVYLDMINNEYCY
jgi:hypothetical protein